jgi:SatD family (SatD)
MQSHYILMADIIQSSRATSGRELMETFQGVIRKINQEYSSRFYSPMTITLGDEFQSVVVNLDAGIQSIIALEEELLALEKPFSLRYVLHYGKIETPLNPVVAYEMIGPGLTDARKMLNQLKSRSKVRFEVRLANQELSEHFSHLFHLYQYFYDRWNKKDCTLVNTFLEFRDYKIVARKLSKDPSLVWRRNRSLCIPEYISLKQLLVSSTKLIRHA